MLFPEESTLVGSPRFPILYMVRPPDDVFASGLKTVILPRVPNVFIDGVIPSGVVDDTSTE